MTVMRDVFRQSGVATTDWRAATVEAAKAEARSMEAQATLKLLGTYEDRVNWLSERAEKMRGEVVFAQARVSELKAARAVAADVEKAEAFGRKALEDFIEAEAARVEAAAKLHEASPMLRKEMERGLFSEEDLAKATTEAREARLKLTEAERAGKIEERLNILGKERERALKLANAAAEAEAKAGVLKAVKESWDAAKAGVKAVEKETRKELRIANKLMGVAEGQIPVAKRVDDMLNNITRRLTDDVNLKEDDVISTTGRLKERIIKMTPEQRALAESRGMLNTRLMELRESMYQSLAPRMAMQERFGATSTDSLVERIRDSYAPRIDQLTRQANVAKRAGEKKNAKRLYKLAARLQAEQESAIRDTVMGVKRLYKQPLYNEDPQSVVAWGLGKLKQGTYLRYGAGFILNVLPDLATAVLHGGFKTLAPSNMRMAYSLVKRLKMEPDSPELRTLVSAVEMTLHHSRTARMNGMDDVSRTLGIGREGSLRNAVTKPVDGAMEFMTEKMAQYSGVQQWNSFWKVVAGLVQVKELRVRVGRYADLSEKERMELALLGIGEHEAARLDYYFKTFGKDEGALFDPNAGMWAHGTGKDGNEMHRVLRIAIRRLQDRAIMTPGAGDTPLLMSSQLGGAILQLSTFGFTSVNRFLRPAAQRAAIYGDGQTAASLAMALVLGGMVGGIRSWMNGEDPADKSAKEIAWEAIDRAGFLAYVSPYIDAATKVAGPGLNNLAGVELVKPTGRFARNRWYESLMGPNMSTIGSVGGTTAALAEGDLERARNSAFYLAPFNQWARIGNAVYRAVNE